MLWVWFAPFGEMGPQVLRGDPGFIDLPPPAGMNSEAVPQASLPRLLIWPDARRAPVPHRWAPICQTALKRQTTVCAHLYSEVVCHSLLLEVP